MCNVIMQNGEIIRVDADDYLFNEKTRIIRLFINNNEIAKFNIDKIAGVVNNNKLILEKKENDKFPNIFFCSRCEERRVRKDKAQPESEGKE